MNRLTGFFATGAAALPVEGELPPLGGATGWLNSPPLTPAELRGNVFRNLPAGGERQAWDNALTTLVNGFNVLPD